MTTDPVINFKILEHHANLVSQSRDRLLHSRFDPHLSQPLFGEIVLPKFSRRANGCRIEDLQGNEFIDWTGGLSANLLGHRHASVVAAIKYWADDDPVHELDLPASADTPFTDANELAIVDRLSDIFPGELLFGFTRGRREALYSAVEMARTLTGRPMVAVHAVHTTKHLHCQDQRFDFGRSHFQEPNERIVSLGDLKAMTWLVNKFPDQVAALVVNPFEYEYPEPSGFGALEKLLSDHGVLLIVDESATAFRMELGGAQQHFSIHPDITIAGENLAGPFSFSAVFGKTELLKKTWRSTIRAQDRPAGLTLDVVNATLKFVVENHLPTQLSRSGGQLQEEFDHLASQAGIGCKLLGHPSHLTLEFEEHESIGHDELRATFSLLALEEGVVTHGEFWPNWAHDDRAVTETIDRLERAIGRMAKWIDAVPPAITSTGQVEQTKAVPAINATQLANAIRGRIDNLSMIRKTMVLSGWMLIGGETVELSALCQDGTRIAAEVVHRGDLGANMPHFPAVASAGFRLSVPVDSIKKTSRFLIDGHQNGRRVYRTLLVHDPHLQTSGPYPFEDGFLFT